MKNYCIEEEYLKTYKEKLISAMLLNILTYSDIKNFNMTRHIVAGWTKSRIKPP